jgi:hypothetical protein
MPAAYTAKGDSFAAGKPHPWSNPLAENDGDWNLDAAPDGKRLLNFFDELRWRVPASGE